MVPPMQTLHAALNAHAGEGVAIIPTNLADFYDVIIPDDWQRHCFTVSLCPRNYILPKTIARHTILTQERQPRVLDVCGNGRSAHTAERNALRGKVIVAH